MPPRFRFPENQYLWLPLSEFAVSQQRAARGIEVFARLKPGKTLEQAQQESDAVASNLAAAFPETNQGVGAYVESLRHWALPDDVKLIILTMMGAVTMVLLIACFNVANLMLARASSRSREMSIRTALGAGTRTDSAPAADRERHRRPLLRAARHPVRGRRAQADGHVDSAGQHPLLHSLGARRPVAALCRRRRRGRPASSSASRRRCRRRRRICRKR